MFRRIAAVAAGSALAVALNASQTPATARVFGSQASKAVPTPPIPPPLSAADRWRDAEDLWSAGAYPDALSDLIALMKSPSAAEYLERVALLSGELFTTSEVTTDGRNPNFSPDGEYVSFETGPTTATVTRIVRVRASPEPVAELRGREVAFDPASRRAVYVRLAGPGGSDAPQAPNASAAPQERPNASTFANSSLGRGELVVRDLITGSEQVIETAGLLKSAPLFAADGQHILFVGSDSADLARSDIYLSGDHDAPVRLTDQPGYKANVLVDPSGAALVYTVSAVSPFRPTGAVSASPAGRQTTPRGGRAGASSATRGAAPGSPAAVDEGTRPSGTLPLAANPCGTTGRGAAPPAFGVVDLRARSTRLVTGSGATMSADGGTLAWLVRTADGCALDTSPTFGEPVRTVRSASRLEAPALSPDGTLVAYQMMLPTGTDWEIFVSTAAGVHRRITREIQHDVLPRFLSQDLLLGMVGEARHRRSYLYDLRSGERVRLFANNTIRTISPEYSWLAGDGGRRLLVQAERDGDTVSPERGIYVVDLTRKVTGDEVLARLEAQLAAENDLRQRMAAAFRPIRDLVRTTVARISATRAYEYGKAQFDFDSKYITQPGNAKAIDYLNRAYTSFGYTPDLQWFAPAQGNRTANVVATLRGTENPDLVYVVSSHFDSVPVGPGADDDTSGTCALLETARVLAHTPLPATVMFASFTGEEAGLLGSREFVRLAAARKWNIAGALNNDMIGWAGESARMDNTIRYSNPGIRDLQHGAAFLFTRLVTYDAKYYKNTDAQAFYDGWGDIVGGLGSYPVLANPNYHQPTDLLETVNFEQVAESARVTAATIIYLASSPSRIKTLKAERSPSAVQVSWQPSPEVGVKSYIVAYGPRTNPVQHRLTVARPAAVLPSSLAPGTVIGVKAVNARGLEGWDWARTVLQ